MNFKESLDYLYGLGYELSVKKFGLENSITLLNALGNPQENFLKVQVAGTNGKGSTCAFLESICVQAGIKVGLNTSPHLVSITERIKINGLEISEEKFAEYVTKVRELSENLVESGELEGMPTFFEHITAIAQIFFADEKVEIAILETGLGGRFDATTATNAEIVAITPIDLDHTNILGNTIEEIASEKAAIIRKGVKAVIGKQNENALEVILQQCKKNDVVPIVDNCKSEYENFPEINIWTKNVLYPVVELGLKGDHQIQNACVAINLAEVLADNFDFKISRRMIIEGLEKAKHQGRLEYWNSEKPTILFDGAHNVAGAKVLGEYLERFHQDTQITMVFGAMSGKDISKIGGILFPFAKNLILTQPENPRSATAEDLRSFAEQVIDSEKIFLVSGVADAIDSAKQLTLTYTDAKPSLVLVTGSLYLIGEIQGLLREVA